PTRNGWGCKCSDSS
ncbi:matrix protein 2, partial [Influenza A virus (A/northern pintail/Alaska/44340-441/2007(H11N9))]